MYDLSIILLLQAGKSGILLTLLFPPFPLCYRYLTLPSSQPCVRQEYCRKTVLILNFQNNVPQRQSDSSGLRQIVEFLLVITFFLVRISLCMQQAAGN